MTESVRAVVVDLISRVEVAAPRATGTRVAVGPVRGVTAHGVITGHTVGFTQVRLDGTDQMVGCPDTLIKAETPAHRRGHRRADRLRSEDGRSKRKE